MAAQRSRYLTDHEIGLLELVDGFAGPPIARKNRPEFATFIFAVPDNLAGAANCAGRRLVKPSRAVNAIADRQLIGSNIRLGRKLAGEMRQNQFADRINERLGTKTTISDISRWEHGHRTPSLPTMRRDRPDPRTVPRLVLRRAPRTRRGAMTVLLAFAAAIVIVLPATVITLAIVLDALDRRRRRRRPHTLTDREIADALAPFGADISVWPSRAPRNGTAHEDIS